MATRLPAEQQLLRDLVARGTPSLDTLARYLGATPAEVTHWSTRHEPLPPRLQDQLLRVALAFVPSLVRPAKRPARPPAPTAPGPAAVAERGARPASRVPWG